MTVIRYFYQCSVKDSIIIISKYCNPFYHITLFQNT
jgi:hypothetical protein